MTESVSISPPSPKTLLSGYQPLTGVYDEAFDPNSGLRPHWQTLIGELNRLGPDEVHRRWHLAQKQIANDGITFNPYDMGGVASRPWMLDAVPLVLPELEWNGITESLGQRARLFDLILRDLYGPQNLLRERILPPDVLYGHPGFYPAYHGLPTPEGQYLTLYAADLARAPDGRWWVMGDRTRAPFGLGHSLENRITTSRMLPQAFRHCKIQRLAPFFVAMQETLRDIAPRSRDNPRIVLWSKGPASRAYFEDAYLARYLGYTLAEGGDLAVRENRVWLKTLGGLLPVEVLFRRLDEDDCDAVELNPNSHTGVSGLLEVLRSSNVVICNALGTRLVESPIVQAFLPSISQFLLGEPLKMPSVATWWCGQPEALEYVLKNLDSLVIRNAFRHQNEPPLHPGQMSDQKRAELVTRLRARPELFVGQESVVRSTAPAMTDEGIAPWHVALRSFLIHHDDGFVALPGGLARVSPESDLLDFTMTSGERSQDVWVCSEQPIERVSLLAPPGETVALRRSGSDLPSRVADNLFWLGRQVERAEGNARLLRTVLSTMTGEVQSTEVLQRLFRVLAEQGQLDPDFVVEGLRTSLPAVEEVLPEAIFDPTRSRSLRATLNEAARLVSIVRDRVSVDAWRVIHRIDEDFQKPTGRAATDTSDVQNLLDQLLTELLAFAGLAQESMTRGQGWRFLDLGRRIERAWQTSVLLRGTLAFPIEEEQPMLETVLQTADSIMTYRTRYLATMQTAPVLDLLLVDETNPRSIGYQLQVIESHLEELPRGEHAAVISPEQRIALSLRNAVRLAVVTDLARVEASGNRPALERLLKQMDDRFPKLSDAVSSRFLIHAGLSRHYGSFSGE
ncbi:MAG: circularly permuted type 2 ATP-grasp protein [Planctomycetaceae bacterium]|nr:circularly permuted type 2 ATP-grasp protein [Planctomycetaceae bacterium]